MAPDRRRRNFGSDLRGSVHTRAPRQHGSGALNHWQLRRRQYEDLQKAYTWSAGEAADLVLSGNCEKTPITFSPEETLAFWQSIMSRESIMDERPVCPVRDTVWSLLDPITELEIRNALRAKNTAPGINGITLAAVREFTNTAASGHV